MNSFKSLNQINESLIKREFSDKKIEWSDTDLFDMLTFSFRRRFSTYSKETSRKISYEIDELIDSYSKSRLKYSDFLKKLKVLFDEINKFEEPSPSYDTYDRYSYYFSKYKNVFLTGPGGIGKSRFVYEISQKLKLNKIDYICFYAKYFKRFTEKQIKKIIDISKERNFVFIFDAINELDEKKREDVIRKIKRLKRFKNIFIIVTYRLHALSKSPNDSLGLKEINFNGINYNSVLEMLGPEVGKSLLEYGSIVSTNNPLFIKALVKKIRKDKAVKRYINNICRLTNLLELYVKDVVGSGCWSFYKSFINLICEEETKNISSDLINKIISSEQDKSKLQKLIENDYIYPVKYGSKTFYMPVYDTLSDFLIARSLFEIDDINSLVSKIKSIKGKIYSLNDPIVLMLFDKFNGNFNLIASITSTCDLSINVSTLALIDLDNARIKDLQKYIKVDDYLTSFIYLAGLNNKVFNCINYFNSLFINDSKLITKLLIQRGNYNKEIIEQRIFDVLYITSVFNSFDERYYEYLYFSIWISAFPQQSIRLLARKVMIQLFDIDERYEKAAIDIISKIDNCFVSDGVIEALASSIYRGNSFKTSYLTSLLKSKKFINAYNIAKIERYLDFPRFSMHYIKRNDLLRKKDNWYTDENKKLFERFSLVHKNSLCFDLFGDGYNSVIKFLNCDWKVLNKINKKLSKEYLCFKTGKCSGAFYCEDKFKKLYKVDDEKIIKIKDFAILLSYYFDLLKSKYGISLNDLPFDYQTYSDSMLWLFLEISQSMMLGTLMSNYFTNEFLTYNGYEGDEIGYAPYQPLQFESDYYCLNSLVPVNNDQVYALNNLLMDVVGVKNIDKKTEKWAKDYFDLKTIERKLNQAVFESDGHLWIPLVACVGIKGSKTDGPRQFISYYCAYNTDFEYKNSYEDINDMYNLNPDDYLKDINDYCNFYEKCRCHNVPSFSRFYTKFKDNSVVLPPAGLINDLKLHYNSATTSFDDEDGEQIILLDCNNVDYYSKNVKHSVFMRQDFFVKIQKKIKFFGYGERYHNKVGMAEESKNDFYVDTNSTIKFFKRKRKFKKVVYPNCIGCKKKYRYINSRAKPGIVFNFSPSLSKLIEK